ncbi:MAG: hypothetical protein NTW78_01895 [Campylobacterales bacterium]|nr:hypothetical protein [Campylobacterales bacterium]
MYKYFIYGVLVWAVAYLSIFFIALGNPSNTSKWVHDVYAKKTIIASATPSPRVVISAGSNALFGIDSKAISKAFNLPVVNYAVNAGLMLPVILYKTKQIIREGDILIMPLEYDMYLYDGNPNEQMIDYITSYEPNILSTLTIKEQFYTFWQITLKSILIKQMQEIQTPKDIYGAHNIDSHGDQLNTKKADQTQQQRNELQATKPYNYNNLYKGNELSYTHLKEFAVYCQQNHIKLILVPSVLLYKPDYKDKYFFNFLPQKLKELGFTYTGNPYDYMYNEEFFFNTDYHLNSEAREYNTQKIIKELLPDLKH